MADETIDFDDLSDVRELAKELPTLRFTTEFSARQHGEQMAKLLTDLCDEIERLRDTNFYPLGKLDPDDPLDQAFVKAWNKGSERRAGSTTSKGDVDDA